MRSRVSSPATLALSCSLVLILFVPMASSQNNVQGYWTQVGTMPINPVHAALLPTGNVLVVAGSGNCPPSQAGCPSGPPYGPPNGSGALLLSPSKGQILSQFSLSWDMFCNGMVLLEDGRPLIDGGTIQYDPFYGQPKVSVFEPATNTFSDIQSMAHGRWYPTVLTLGDGRVMAFSGLNETGGTNSTVEFYTIGSGWSSSPASWTPDLYPRLHLLPNGKVFYSGAQTASKLFDPATTTWITNFATTNYSGSRTYGTSVLLPLTPENNYDPKVIIMGGGNPSTSSTEIIDLATATPAWQYGPNMSQPRIEMNAVILPNGKVLAIGGSLNDEDTSTSSQNADLYDPATNTFSSAGANGFPRLYHSVALLLPDATVWFAGGNPTRGTYVQPMEIYYPPYLYDSNGAFVTRPSISSAPSNVNYGNIFTVQTPDAASISSVILVRNGSVTHAFGMDQREVGLSFTSGTGSLMVTAPPNSNIAPPGYYMLFILNSSGVPSLASFIQVTAAPPDFAVSATPASSIVRPGTGASYMVTVAPSNGFDGNVSFAVTGLPSGVTPTFTPGSLFGSGSSTLSLATSSSTPAGSYPLTITATSGTLSHSTQVTLVVADFSVSASPSSQTVRRGSKTSYTVTITALGPFSSVVSFSASGVPKRTSASFSPTSVSGSGTSTLTISTNRNSPTGTYSLTISASGGGITHSANVSLSIQ